MATLSNELQDAITTLQTKHDNLVQAVRDYTGGSVADATNELLEAQASAEDAIDTKEAALLALIGYGSTTPQPSTILDFSSNMYLDGIGRVTAAYAFDDLMSFSRDSEGTFFGQDGKIQTAGSGEARRQYDPATGAALGVLIEPSSENIIPWSQDFSQPSWVVEGGVVDASPAIDPAGGSSAFVLTEDATTGQHNIRDSNIPLTGDSVSMSVFFNTGGSDRSISLRLSGMGAASYQGTFDATGALLFADEELETFSMQLSGGWVRVGITAPTGGATSITQAKINTTLAGGTLSYDGDGVSTVSLFGAQIEEIGQVTSYIPTAGAPVAREADSLTLREFPSVNAEAFTVFADVVQGANPGAMFSISGGENDMRVGAPTNNNTAINGSQLDIGVFYPSVSVGSRTKAALSMSGPTASLAMNGEYSQGSAPGSLYGSTQFRIGGLGANNNNIGGTVRQVVIYPRALSQSEITTLTTL